MIFEAS